MLSSKSTSRIADNDLNKIAYVYTNPSVNSTSVKSGNAKLYGFDFSFKNSRSALYISLVYQYKL
jgi:hypothetical protein